MTDDLNLLHRAQSREPRAWEEILERYGGMVYSLARQMTGSATDAEDVVQEVFLRVHRDGAKFRGEAKLSSWIYRIAINVCIAHRTGGGGPNMELRADMETEDLAPAAEPVSPDTSAESRILRDRIEKAVRCLSPRERAVFVLRHHEDLSLKEIAEALNVRLGTVKALLFRAVEKMQGELAHYRSE